MLKVFGSKCFTCVRCHREDKLSTKSKACIFLEYSQSQTGYLGYDPTELKLYSSRDVQFIECDFWLNSLLDKSSTNEVSPTVSVGSELNPSWSEDVGTGSKAVDSRSVQIPNSTDPDSISESGQEIEDILGSNKN